TPTLRSSRRGSTQARPNGNRADACAEACPVEPAARDCKPPKHKLRRRNPRTVACSSRSRWGISTYRNSVTKLRASNRRGTYGSRLAKRGVPSYPVRAVGRVRVGSVGGVRVGRPLDAFV